MTEFDKTLIKKANEFSRWDYRKIDELIILAQTEEAVDILANIQLELRDLVYETL